MIAKLKGLLDSTGLDWAIIDVGGVGYLVSASSRTLRRLGGVGEAVSVLTEMWVSEDKMQLFAFADVAERDWFRLLTTVQGVGARVALAVLSVLSPEQIAQALMAQDKTALTQADGVGPKLATRMISELKDKVPALALTPTLAGTPAGKTDAAAAPAANGAVADAVSALVNLGYKRLEAFAAVTTCATRLGPEAGVSELIRAGLKELSA
ncbi:Holliday junction branch migration protein RuvA [Nitrospirillum sp. BR 11163]|uniref:Holliday junction branch migration protein RuvA n=1 Tax=Nitrospirillum sp. BR 11163 TaxID=3104323 RepID=UPI002AFF8E2D|nr:Holliday junction branch migration protein RuvA [Nitrospirillum sp. BR 11163]MEA1676788.1 Holliday junction branch migration protein RuvA [Nitrospirillum sp. BR 11163]